MPQKKIEKFKIISNEKIVFEYEENLVEYYKRGYSLIELSRIFHIDFSLIIYIIKHAKIKRAQLHRIYEEQSEQKERSTMVCIQEKELKYVEKFFPQMDDAFTNSYYIYWKEKYKKSEERKQKCEHKVRHIQCSLCNTILEDAPE